MTALLERVVLPVVSVDDATASARALAPHAPAHIIAVHVIEKAGGAPDKASVEQREVEAEKIFSALEGALAENIGLETDLRYGTDVAETVFDAAADHDATAVVIRPRGGSRWVQLLTGDVALDIVTKTDRPVVVLPDIAEDQDGEHADDVTAGGSGS